jgi:UDP-2,3-diacylglucosamine hydrolase
MRLPAPCYVLSDAHLGAAPDESERDLLAFLRDLPADAKSLVINGDLFDFWFEWRQVVPRAGVRVLGELARLRDRGLPILWIAGNHDCWGGAILREDLGLDYRFGPWRGEIGGWDVLIEHGDGLRDKEDAPYRRLRAVLRHPWAVRAYRWIHPDIGTWIALRSSHTSRNMRPRDGGEGLRRVAEQRLTATDAPGILIFGHSHLQTMERIGRGVFANPGAWMDGPTALRITERQVELVRWSASAVTTECALERTPSGS